MRADSTNSLLPFLHLLLTCFCRILSVCLSLCLSLSISRNFSLSLYLSLSHTLSLFISLSHTLSLSLSLSLSSTSTSFFPSYSQFHSLHMFLFTISLFLFDVPNQSFHQLLISNLSICLSIYLSIYLSCFSLYIYSYTLYY